MYNVIVPLFNRSVTADTREIYLKQFKDAKVSQILLAIFGYGTDPATDLVTANSLRENIEFFKKEGIKAGVWIGYTIGHGCDLVVGADNVPDISGYTKMVDLAGQERAYVCCPSDENFRRRIAQYVSTIATSGTELVLLDDDFRMSQHGPEFCCACDRHMARISELCGEEISREALKKHVFAEKANKYRSAWLTAQSESLESLASDVREAVDKVAPTVRVGFCNSHAVWGVDGTDPIKLAKILAGKHTKPFMRTQGAPYWHVTRKGPIQSVIEQARHIAYMSADRGVEIISEGDTYPRPRYIVPASLLEMYDAAMRIDGRHDGILKYMVEYNATAEFETSYLDKHTRNLPLMDALSEMFAGKEMLGVNVSCRGNVFDEADLEMGVSGLYPYPCAGAMMSFNGISTVYGKGGICRAVFGEEARHIDLSEIENGAVLDGIAAQILSDRGVDVGIEDRVCFENKRISFITDSKGIERGTVDVPDVRYANVEISARASLVSHGLVGNQVVPLAYTYENSDGAKFLVYLFDSMALRRNTGMYRGYMQQKTLKEGIEWVSGKRIPAFVEKCPDLYLMCKGGEGRMAVALFNFFADSIDEPIITLDREYSNIRFINCSGRLENDRVILNNPIYSNTLAAFEVW